MACAPSPNAAAEQRRCMLNLQGRCARQPVFQALPDLLRQQVEAIRPMSESIS